MNTLKQEFITFVQKNRLFEPGDRVQVACSGGSDSIALLKLLHQTKQLFRVQIFCTHVDHGLRQTSSRDAEFVENLCSKWGIHFSCRKIMEQPEGNIENWARDKRRSLLEQTATELNLSKTALAHNAGDRAETLLHNIARGSGLEGAGNMDVRAGTIVRPLLFATKMQILAYLDECGQNFVTDETNEDDSFSRNRIRHNVIPELENIFPQATENISRFAGLALDDSRFLDELASQAMKNIIKGDVLNVYDFSQQPTPIKRRMLRLLVRDGYPPALSAIDNAIEFIEKSDSGKVIVIGKMKLIKLKKNIVNVFSCDDKSDGLYLGHNGI